MIEVEVNVSSWRKFYDLQGNPIKAPPLKNYIEVYNGVVKIYKPDEFCFRMPESDLVLCSYMDYIEFRAGEIVRIDNQLIKVLPERPKAYILKDKYKEGIRGYTVEEMNGITLVKDRRGSVVLELTDEVLAIIKNSRAPLITDKGITITWKADKNIFILKGECRYIRGETVYCY